MIEIDNKEKNVGFRKSLYYYFINGPELEFLVDLLKNSIVFIGIFLIAVGLHTVVSWLESGGYPWIIVNGLWLVENILFVGDIVWFGCKIVVSTFLATVSIFKTIR